MIKSSRTRVLSVDLFAGTGGFTSAARQEGELLALPLKRMRCRDILDLDLRGLSAVLIGLSVY